MLRGLAVVLALLGLADPARACEAGAPAEPGLVVEICTGTASITGPGTVTGNVYRDADPSRLPEVRIVGDGSRASVYVARLDREGILMDSAVGPRRLAAGVAYDLSLYFEFLLLERDAEDVAYAPTGARRVLRSPRTPLSDGAAARASSACFAFRHAVPAPFLGGVGSEFILRSLRALRRGREQLTRRFAGAPATELDRRFFAPLLGALRRGNRYLLAADRRWRSGRGGIERMIRAYERRLPREERLRGRLGLSECEATQLPAAAS